MIDNVKQFPGGGDYLGHLRDGLHGGGGGGDNGDMETRVARLEDLAAKTGERLARIETDLAVMKAQAAHYATKADVADAKAAIIMWVVGAIFLAQLLPPFIAWLRAITAQ